MNRDILFIVCCYVIMFALVAIQLMFSYHLTWYMLGWFPLIKARNLTDAEKEVILRYGVSHMTTEKGRAGIKKNGTIKGSRFHKAYSNHYKKCCYFHANGNLAENSESFNANSKYCNKITITNLTPEQLKKCKVRKYDNSIMYMGDFIFLQENNIKWEEVEKIKITLKEVFDCIKETPFDPFARELMGCAIMCFGIPIFILAQLIR